MEPTIHDFSLHIVNKMEHNFQYYDVIVFRSDLSPNKVMIKRLYGLPGDTVLIKDGKILINNRALPTYTNVSITESGLASEGIVLNSDEYFFLGDNLEESIDSRFPEVGIIKEDAIIGKIIK